MNARKVVLNAVQEARGLLIYHIQTKHGREPEKTIEDLRKALESTAVAEAVRKLTK